MNNTAVNDSAVNDTAVNGLSTLVCAISPFDGSGALDTDAVGHLMERFASAGVGTYIGGSSPGEGYALTMDETETLFASAHQAMGGRQPVRAMGIEPHSAEALIPILRLAQETGLDGAQVYSLDLGHGNRPTPGEQEAYFRAVIEAVDLSLYLSSHFAGGYLVPVPLLATLLEDYPHLQGFNITTPDTSYLGRVLDVARGRAAVHVGGPLQALTAMAMGAQGFLSADGNLAPRLCASVIDHYADGRHDEAQAAFARLLRVFAINRWGGSMRWLKAGMAVFDLPGHHLRAPFQALDEADRATIRAALEGLDVPATEGYPGH